MVKSAKVLSHASSSFSSKEPDFPVLCKVVLNTFSGFLKDIYSLFLDLDCFFTHFQSVPVPDNLQELLFFKPLNTDPFITHNL